MDKTTTEQRKLAISNVFLFLLLLVIAMMVGYGFIALSEAVPNFWIKGFLALAGLIIEIATFIVGWKAFKVILEALNEDPKGKRDGTNKVG